MALLDYTTFEDIRAALGVSSEELDGSTLTLSIYENNLANELDDISLTLSDQFIALQEILPADMTLVQRQFNRATQLFATYAVAKMLTSALPMFSAKEVTDGKAAVNRFSLDPYKETVKGVGALYSSYRTRLEAAYAGLSAVSVALLPTQTYFAVASPTSDPVLGT